MADLSVNNCYTYVLTCADGSYYTGWTKALARRIQQHNCGKGAKYLKSRLPATLKAFWVFETPPEAMRLEHKIKTLTRHQKEMFLAKLPCNPAILDVLVSGRLIQKETKTY